MIGDQRGMVTNVCKKVGGGGWHFEDDGGSQGNGDQGLSNGWEGGGGLELGDDGGSEGQLIEVCRKEDGERKACWVVGG
jgi:hypothetical protein